MVSMKDIAKKCGVSVATVSKALNDQSDVGKATKNMIRKVAEELGYVTNSNARTLKTNKTKNIGVLFMDAQNAGLAHEYFSTVLESFRAEAEKHDYDITFINNKVEGQTYLKHCRYRNFDGVVIILADFDDPDIIELVNSDIPVVTVDKSYPGRCSVSSDNASGLQQLTSYAIEMGHKDICFMHGEKTDVTEQRIMGFYKTMFDHKIPLKENSIVQARYHDIQNCYEKTKEVLSKEQRPSCIIFPDDYSYLGGVQAIIDSSLSIPEDISVIGYDGISLAITLGLTTFKQNTADLGRIAAKNLIEHIETGKQYNEQVVVSGTFIKGKTVKKLN